MKEVIRSIDIKNWYDLLLRKEKFSNFIDRDIKRQLQVLLNETKELGEAIDNNNIEEIRKELLDVLFNQGQLINKLLKEGIIDKEFMSQSGKQQKEKIFKRSSFLKKGYKPTVDEEEKEWYDSKGTTIQTV